MGLGDFHLEHQVLLRRDLVAFALLILVGFIFLANFLVKLTESLSSLIPHEQDNFENALKETKVLGFSKRNLDSHDLAKEEENHQEP